MNSFSKGPPYKSAKKKPVNFHNKNRNVIKSFKDKTNFGPKILHFGGKKTINLQGTYLVNVSRKN